MGSNFFLRATSAADQLIREGLKKDFNEQRDVDIIIMVIHKDEPLIMAVPNPTTTPEEQVKALNAFAEQIEMHIATRSVVEVDDRNIH